MPAKSGTVAKLPSRRDSRAGVKADAIQWGGGGVAEFFRDLKKPTRFSGGGGGGSSSNFPLSSVVAKSNFDPTFSDIRG